MKRYVIGDIHGEYEKLKQCLELSNFDFENDLLISLGDIVDRGTNVYGCIELLSTINNLILVRGNHDDEWVKGLMDYNEDQQNQSEVFSLFNHGSRHTLQSYTRIDKHPLIHLDFFSRQKPYYIDDENNLFIHGGFNRHHLLKEQSEVEFYWDRDLFLAALSYKNMIKNEHPFKMKDNFKEVFIGHTPTMYWGSKEPINAANIWNIDTGSGKNGELTILNIDTKEFYQSY